MKKIFASLLSLQVFICFAQLPAGFNYQAFLRNDEGNPMGNEAIYIYFKIRQNTTDGPIVFEEEHYLTSTETGLLTATVGYGLNQVGDLESVDWECCDYYLEVQGDNGNGIVPFGTQRLESVPFALVSENARNSWKLDGNAGLNPNEQFIGTTDYTPLLFRTFNTTRMAINEFGRIGIGITEPQFAMHIHDGLFNGFNGLQITNYYTGTGDYDGLVLEVDDFGYANIQAQYQSYLRISNTMTSIIMDGSHVGIGASYPQKRLHVSDSDYQFRISSESDANFWNFGASADNWGIGPNKFIIHNLEQSGGAPFTINGTNDYVGIEDTSPSYNLEVNGSAAKPGGGSWTAPSDARLKQHINPYEDGLEEVMQIEPVRYQYTAETDYNTEQVHIGVIAQDLQKVAPYMVGETEMEFNDGRRGTYLDVDPSALVYMLINAVQEQQKLIDELNNKIEVLSNQSLQKPTED
jgi:hypothetical protein